MAVTYIPRAFGGTIVLNSSPPPTRHLDATYTVVGSGFVPGIPGNYGNVVVHVYRTSPSQSSELEIETIGGTVISDTTPMQGI